MINVDVMTGAFDGHCITPLVGINSMFAEELNMRLVQYQHFGREQEYSQEIDLAVSIEAPAEGLMGHGENNSNEDDLFHMEYWSFGNGESAVGNRQSAIGNAFASTISNAFASAIGNAFASMANESLSSDLQQFTVFH